jgi:hypothetical protein
MYKVAVAKMPWLQTSIDRPHFTSKAERNLIFKTNKTLVFQDLVQYNMGNNITPRLVLRPNKGQHIFDLLRNNYVIILPDSDDWDRARFYFADFSQDSGGQIIAECDLDDITTNVFEFNNFRVFAERVSNKYAYDSIGISSKIIVPENITLNKFHSTSDLLKISGCEALNNNPNRKYNDILWAYFIFRYNKDLDNLGVSTYKYTTSNGNFSKDLIDSQLMVLCAPLTPIYVVDYSGNRSIISIGSLLEYISINLNLSVGTLNDDFMRIIRQSGIPSSVNNVQFTLKQHLMGVKFSYRPPFNLNDMYLEFNNMASGPSIPDILLRYPDLGVDGVKLMYKTTTNRNHCFNVYKSYGEITWLIDLHKYLENNDGSITKLNGLETKELRLTTPNGQYIVIDLNTIRGLNLRVHAREEFLPDTSYTYYYVTEGTEGMGIFPEQEQYKFSYRNYTGLIDSTDYSVPYYIDAVDSFFASNRNYLNEHALDRASQSEILRRQQQGEIKQFITNSTFDLAKAGSNLGASSLVGEGGASPFALAGAINTGMNILNSGVNLGITQGLEKRKLNILQTQQVLKDNMKVNDLQYAPVQYQGASQGVFNFIIADRTPSLDLYELLPFQKAAIRNYFDQFGYAFNDFISFNTIFNTGGFYKLNLFYGNTSLSNMEFQRISKIFSDGVYFKDMEVL